MTSADRLDGGRHGARLLLVGLTSGVLLAWAAVATPAANPRASAATAVCGTLTADAEYSAEVGFIGVAHACEHLRDRKFTGASARTVVASHSHAVAAAGLAAAADPIDVGRWSAATNPGTKTIGVTAVVLHTGKVLLFGGQYSSTNKKTAAYLFDPIFGDRTRGAGSGHGLLRQRDAPQRRAGPVRSAASRSTFRPVARTSGSSTRSPSSGSGSPTRRSAATIRRRRGCPTGP